MNLRPAPAQTPRTGTSLLYALTAQLQQYPDGISLGRGDPDFTTPAHILDAVRQSLDASDRDLANPAQAQAELMRLIAERLRAINHIEVDPRTEIVLAQGGQEALFLMVQAALAPGDEVIVPDPNYNSYRDAVAFAGATRVLIPSSVETNFDIDPDRVRRAITPKTRALVMVSPNNPTAAVLSPDRVRDLVTIAEEHDLMILADDTYDRFLFDGAVHTSPASLPGMRTRTLTLNTFSKTYAMTGWRLGWIAGPASLAAQVRRLKEAVSGGISILALRAGIAALAGPQEPVAEMREAYARRRRIVMDAMDEIGLGYGTPQGGQFILVDIRPTGVPSVEFARRLLEEGHVLVYPGVSFGDAWDGFVRMTFLQPEPALSEAMRRTAGVVAGLR